jgi:hypothetical protein
MNEENSDNGLKEIDVERILKEMEELLEVNK